mgnify:CR=1 FL=1
MGEGILKQPAMLIVYMVELGIQTNTLVFHLHVDGCFTRWAVVILCFICFVPLPMVSNFNTAMLPQICALERLAMYFTGFNPNLVYPSKMNIVKKYHLKHFDGNDDH